MIDRVMSGLDEKGREAAWVAIFAGDPAAKAATVVTIDRDDLETAIAAYLATTTPADMGELVKRLRQAAETSASGRGEWYQLVHRCREAATVLERVTRERDELERRAGDAIMGEAAAIERAESAEAKLAEALARLETVEAETRELRARNDPMRVLGDPRVGVTIGADMPIRNLEPRQ